MKRGCVLKFLLLIPIVIGIIYYVGGKYGQKIVDTSINKFDDLFSTYLKEKKIEFEENAYLDSVKIIIENYLGELTESEVNEIKSGKNEVIEFIKTKLSDISIDSIVFNEIKYKIEEYERSKEDRN